MPDKYMVATTERTAKISSVEERTIIASMRFAHRANAMHPARNTTRKRPKYASEGSPSEWNNVTR